MENLLTRRAALAMAWVAMVSAAGWVPGGVSAARDAEDAALPFVSPDVFGETVDVVTPGYLHWSRASGDTVDPDGDRGDFDNNFGEHAGAVDTPSFSSQARTYGQGTVADEAVYATGASTVRWEFKVSRPGPYVVATRLWRELQDRTAAVFSYRSGEKWIDLPAIENVQHWGDYSRLTCFVIEVPEGQKTVPVRLRATSGRCLIRRALLGKKREAGPFLPDARPTHPSLHFRAADLPGLREKARSGPPKLAYDYMLQQVSWYANTLERGDKEWQPPNSEHHVERSICQTAFLGVLTEKPPHLDTVVRMVNTVMDWPRHADAIADQRAGFNILARARQLSAMAMAYDWLYDRLPASTARRLARFLDEEANRLYLYNETIVGGVESGNWDPWIAAGYGMAGLALRDEHRWARNWIESGRRIFTLNLCKSNEDFGYFNNGFVKGMDFAISLRTATGADLFTPVAKRLRALTDYRMMLLEPQGKGYPAFGDSQGTNDPLLALCCATYLRDPMAQWFVNHLGCGTAEQVKTWGWNHMIPIAVVTLYDPSLGEQAPGEPRLPLARSFARDPDILPSLRDTTILRTGYTQPGDVQLAFRCGNYAGWHGHPDQGSFVLNACGDNLVVDRALGAPYGTPANDFSKSAPAHSIVLIDKKGQVPHSSPVFYDTEAGHTGPLLHTRFIDYVLADSTVAYRKNPPLGAMERAHRHFLFVRRPDRHAYLVLFDDLKKDGRPHAFDWLLQTDTSHTVAAEGAGHQVIRGAAELHILTLEPKGVEMEKSDHFGIWRTLKLANPAEAPRGLFLNVLYPKTDKLPLPKVERLEGEGFVGARVGAEETFLFAVDAKPISAEGVKTDARIAAVGRQAGKTAWFLCVGATYLEADGRRLFESDKAVTAAFDVARSGGVVSDGPVALVVSVGDGGPTTLKVEAGTTTISEGWKTAP